MVGAEGWGEVRATGSRVNTTAMEIDLEWKMTTRLL
jgi:hypothetical protein